MDNPDNDNQIASVKSTTHIKKRDEVNEGWTRIVSNVNKQASLISNPNPIQ